MRITKFYMVTILVVISLVLYVHQHIESIKLGYVIKNNETKVTQLLDQNATLRYNIEKLENPYLLEKRLESKKMAFTMPERWYIVKSGKPKREPSVARSLENRRSIFDFLVPKALAQVKPTR